MSSICSVPIESRMVEGVMCCSASSSGLICECVVVYGCMTRLLTSATLASNEKICRESMNFHASSCPPLISKVKMLAPPLGKYLVYREWVGCEGSAGWLTLATFGWLARKSTTLSAFST